MRPSCTATTEALGGLVRSTNCKGCATTFAPAAAPAAAGDSGAADAAPGVAALEAPAATDGTAAAPAVALEAGTAGVLIAVQATCLPVTGRRPSIRPVSVAITAFG